MSPPDYTDHERIHRAVADAEAVTGLQVCVMFCLGQGDLHTQAERTFERMGVQERPAALVLVDPVARGCAIEVGEQVRTRLPAADVDSAVEVITAHGDLTESIERGIAALAAVAGASDGSERTVEIPDVITTLPE